MKNDDATNTPTDALAVVQEVTPVRVAAPSKELIVRDGQVILPETQCVKPADKEFEELVLAKAIPRDDLPELLDALHGRRPAYTPVMKLLFFVGFIVIGALAFLFRPHFPELTASDVLVIETQTPSKVSSEFADLLKQANEAFGKGQYSDVKAMIAPKMEALMKDKEIFRANARLVSLFFSAYQKTGFPKNETGFDKWIDEVCKHDPDNLEWQIYRICKNWQPFQDIYKSEFRMEVVLNNEVRARQVNMACLRARTKIDKIRLLDMHKPADRRLSEATVTTLDLMECQVLITKWRLDGGKNLPDDVDDPGVEFREKAFALAARHGNDIAFLDLQLLIAQRVLDGLIPGLPESYYFNGEKHWLRSDLQDLIYDIKMKKQKLSLSPKHP